MSLATGDDAIVAATEAWIEKAVIGLDLCPFAGPVHRQRRIRYRVSRSTAPAALLAELMEEMLLLVDSDPASVETTLLIHPWVLGDFLDYNDFLAVADAALADLGLAATLQIASFHPRYQFAGSAADDVENCTNRSPFPVLHLLRQASVDRAVAAFPDAAAIFEKNMATLRRLGPAGWRTLGLDRGTPAAPSDPLRPKVS